MRLNEILNKRIVFVDGGMGTTLQKMGLAPGVAPETWNISEPERIKKIHSDYLLAGADIITANTFGANSVKSGDKAVAYAENGVKIARKAVDEIGKGFVAMDIGPTGKLLKPMGDLDFEDAVKAFSEMASIGEKSGADCIIIETMSDIYEAKAALLGAKEVSSLPVFVTMTYDESGKLLTGADIETAVSILEGLGADAIGINCGLGPKQLPELLNRLLAVSSTPVILNPNAGLPVVKDGITGYDIGADEFAEYMKKLAEMGVSMIGGCCGTTPEYIEKMVTLCKDILPRVPEKKHICDICSGQSRVVFEDKPVIIGERINPTGKKRFKEALRNEEMSYILSEGITQQDNGAMVLDVNVGLPEIDEKEMMCKVIHELQSVTELPLQIDTSDVNVLESALRLYNGKALINSVTAKEKNMAELFPIMKKYGGVVIGLTITESGIPETAQGRLEAARKIMETAATYGISKDRIIIDPLTMAISACQEAAKITLDSVKLIRSELGLRTSLGVSNVSFGLPNREKINSSFFTMALQSGLDAAIINPNSKAMMDSYYSYCAINCLDSNCMEYISHNSEIEATSSNSASETDLKSAIERGLKTQAAEETEKLLDRMDSLQIINEYLVPALDNVGQKFEKGIIFLPQLLMSADAAKTAFSKIKERYSLTEKTAQNGPAIVLATVKGDVHDIGKNIVKVLLENYGYDVVDLGKDVEPTAVVEATKKHGAKLVGLSALMTTTVPNMEATVKLLHTELPDCKVMVGGAVLNEEYAENIGADFYGKDAMASVRYAEKILK